MIKIKHKEKEIIFDEEKHIYTVDDQRYISVTQNIANFFPKFDLKKISLIYAINHNIDQNSVIEKWENEGKEAAEFGTNIHRYIECKLLKREFRKLKTEKEKIYCENINIWLEKFLKYFRVVDVEKIVFSPRYKLAGSIDAIFQNMKTGKYCVIDWKSNKKIEFKNKWQNCLNGLEMFEACSYIKFMIQINSYLRILKEEKYYNFQQKPELKIIHITKEGIKSINIPILNKKILNIIFKTIKS